MKLHQQRISNQFAQAYENFSDENDSPVRPVDGFNTQGSLSLRAIGKASRKPKQDAPKFPQGRTFGKPIPEQPKEQRRMGPGMMRARPGPGGQAAKQIAKPYQGIHS